MAGLFPAGKNLSPCLLTFWINFEVIVVSSELAFSCDPNLQGDMRTNVFFQRICVQTRDTDLTIQGNAGMQQHRNNWDHVAFRN